MAIQTSSGSTRERWVKALLPGAVIVMVYMLFVHLGNSRKLSDLRDDLRQASESMVTEDQLFALHSQIREAGLSRDGAATELQQIEEQVDGLLSPFGKEPPAQRMVQVSEICGELSIGVIGQESLTHLKMSKQREQAVQEMSKTTGRTPYYYQLELVGSYGNLVELMERVPDRIEGVIPLGVELLKRDDDSSSVALENGQRLWRVYLMM